MEKIRDTCWSFFVVYISTTWGQHISASLQQSMPDIQTWSVFHINPQLKGRNHHITPGAQLFPYKKDPLSKLQSSVSAFPTSENLVMFTVTLLKLLGSLSHCCGYVLAVLLCYEWWPQDCVSRPGKVLCCPSCGKLDLFFFSCFIAAGFSWASLQESLTSFTCRLEAFFQSRHCNLFIFSVKTL